MIRLFGMGESLAVAYVAVVRGSRAMDLRVESLVGVEIIAVTGSAMVGLQITPESSGGWATV